MEEEVVDEGVHDKRLLVQEPELARVLRVMARDGNTLSAIIRDAWDKGNLRALTKNSPAVATGALISIVGHITADELRQELTRTDAANGFANRFLLACVRRSKFLPDGGGQVDLGPLAERLADAIGVASRIAQVCRSAEARALWHRVYEKLSEGRPGLVGAVTGRAEAQVLRLSLLYALLDKSPFIEKRHLEAALELYRFLQQSAEFVFGDSLGDHVADTILVSLRTNPDGLTASEVSALFGRHEDAARIQVARDMLVRRGLVRVERVPTAGRAKVVLKVVVPALDCEKSEFSEKSVTSMAYGPPQAVQECEKRVLDAADEPEGFDL